MTSEGNPSGNAERTADGPRSTQTRSKSREKIGAAVHTEAKAKLAEIAEEECDASCTPKGKYRVGLSESSLMSTAGFPLMSLPSIHE